MNEKKFQCGYDGLGNIVPVEMWESSFPLGNVVEWGKAECFGNDIAGPSRSEDICTKRYKYSHESAFLHDLTYSSTHRFEEFMKDIIYVSFCWICCLWKILIHFFVTCR